MPSTCRVMALTATTTSETFEAVTRRLSMVKPVVVALPTYRDNIYYSVHPKQDIIDFTDSLPSEFTRTRASFPRTVTYVRTYRDCWNILYAFKSKMGDSFTNPQDYPNHPDFRMVDMFTRVITDHKSSGLFHSVEERLGWSLPPLLSGWGLIAPIFAG